MFMQKAGPQKMFELSLFVGSHKINREYILDVQQLSNSVSIIHFSTEILCNTFLFLGKLAISTSECFAIKRVHTRLGTRA